MKFRSLFGPTPWAIEPDYIGLFPHQEGGWTADGAVLIQAESHRSQVRNREDALARLVALIAQAAVRPKRRVPTRPTLASKRRRLVAKTQRGAVKRLRGKPVDDD